MLLTLRNGHRPLDIFENIFNDSIFNLGTGYSDFTKDNNQYQLEVPLAGFKKEDIDITINNEYLNIKATRKEGKIKYERSFYLPRRVKASEVSVEYNNGLLTISLPEISQDNQQKIVIK